MTAAINAHAHVASIATAGGIAAQTINNLSVDIRSVESAGNSDPLEHLVRDGSILSHRFDQYNPVGDLGVHPPIQIGGLPHLPPYASRAVDAELDVYMESGGLILLEGDSAAGKTRSAYEAAARWFLRNPGWKFLRPRDGSALREAVAAQYSFDEVVVWLDDLENYLSSGGLDASLLRTIIPPGKTNVILLATIRSLAKSVFSQSATYPDIPTFAPDIRRLFALARTIRLARELTAGERSGAAQLRSDPRIAAALDNDGGAGLAEYISAGPAIAERWNSGKDGVEPWGAALVSAAIDFRRAGYLAPIPRSWLKNAARSYVGRREARRLNHFKLSQAFSWATELVHGASACLEELEDGKYIAFDYLVDLTQSQTLKEEDELRESGRPGRVLGSVPDEVWHILQDELNPSDPQFLSCVSASALSPHPGLASMFKNGVRSGALDISKFNTEGQLFGLAQVCLRARICVVCQILDLNLDLAVLVRTLFDAVEPVISGEENSATLRQRDALQILYDFADQENFNDNEAPIFKAVASALDPVSLAAIGAFFHSADCATVGQRWLQVADQVSQIRD
ncbi:hypothetical protein NMK34_02205 [Micromonospora sp. BRA006-A]|uniref:hypothetical protein n=1 Tax=Micromonospora TaxID=1873 RepID=UPI00296F32EF|nr:hypothetical protein [Micromonospora sp. BRA006-A]MDW3845417.1 hypothetical protein [Micromonospora sp. BRA006-A]